MSVSRRAGERNQGRGRVEIEESGQTFGALRMPFNFFIHSHGMEWLCYRSLEKPERWRSVSKAGVMVRGTLDANAATVVLDMKPNHEIEFMHRSTAGAQ